MAVDFRLLGEMEVFVDSRPIDVGHARQRCVLAVLLVEANRPVSIDHLVDRVWGRHPLPGNPPRALQTYVALLRRALTSAAGVSLDRRQTGYQLTVDPETIDLHRFLRLIGRDRGTEDRWTAEALERALRLWRGEPFAGLDSPWLNATRDRILAQRQAARLDLTDIQLRQGRHTELLADLADRAGRQPLDERLAGQLMLALYRSGRSADALGHYQHTRDCLDRELGTDPTPPLQRLYQQILTADPALAATGAPGGAPGPTEPTSSAGLTVSTSPAQPIVPHQLPQAPPFFTGRRHELDRLTAALDDAGDTMAIAVIGGCGGIGKSSLALHWAHQHVDRFPDGQLHVNLRGFDPSGQPMPPTVAVRGFLDALGVEPGAVPDDLDAQVGLYRSLIAGRRMLVVLDNARDTAQVTPLLPGSATCAVLITSRDRLSGLITAHGARTVPVDGLPNIDARQLLAARIGAHRLAAEPDTAEELVAVCGGIPLALSIVASRVETHPGFPLAMLAAELRDATTRLDAWADLDPAASLPAVLSWSYHAINGEQARVFVLLGLAPGPDIGLAAVASLTGLSIGRARMVLRELENASLVQQYRPARYRMHDLVRRYAAEHTGQDLPAASRTTALRRLVDHYLHSAVAADRLLREDGGVVEHDTIELEPPADGCVPERQTDPTAASRWFDDEYLCLLAAQQLAAIRGWHAHVWRLAWALHAYHLRWGHPLDFLVSWRAAVVATEKLGDPALHGTARRLLGQAYRHTGRPADALEQTRHALALADAAGDAVGRAASHYALAELLEHFDDLSTALAEATTALAGFRALGDPPREADALNLIGGIRARFGRHESARAACEEALALAGRHDDLDRTGHILDRLGHIAEQSGRPADALNHYEQALARHRAAGDPAQEAETLTRIGDLHNRHTGPDRARAAWQAALEIYATQHRHADIDRIRERLATLGQRITVAANGTCRTD